MIVDEIELAPACLVRLEPFVDERGLFARLSCEEEFARAGLNGRFVQSSLSVTRDKHTLRGLHFQRAPSREAKLVRCIRGVIWDVIVDLRPGSPHFCHYFAAELDGVRRDALYVPAGFAHGFLTLRDDAEVLYQMTDFYRPELSTGVRWNDPAFAINWPIDAPRMNARDAAYPDFDPKSVTGFEAYR